MIISSLTDKVALTDQYGNFIPWPQVGQITDAGNTWAIQGLQNASVNWGYIGSGVYERNRLSKIYKRYEYNLFTSGMGQSFWQPTSGSLKLRVMGMLVCSGAAATFNFVDGAGTSVGTISAPCFLTVRTSGAQSVFIDFGNGYVSVGAGNSLNVWNNGPGTAAVNVTCWGIEE